MSVQVYGCNHIAIEVDDVKKAVAFYKDVFNLDQLRGGEGDAFFKLGEHQFLAIFEVKERGRTAIGTLVSWFATSTRSMRSGRSSPRSTGSS